MLPSVRVNADPPLRAEPFGHLPCADAIARLLANSLLFNLYLCLAFVFSTWRTRETTRVCVLGPRLDIPQVKPHLRGSHR